MGREVSQAGVRVAVDIGGTFTDIVLMSPDGVLSESKVSTTPDDPSRAVVDGLLALLRELRIAPGDVVEILHGTTVGSNTILQKSGAKTGLITTRGFRDVLEIGRIRMPEMFDLTWEQADAAGAAPPSRRGRRAHRRRRQRGQAARRTKPRARRRAAGIRRHRSRRHRFINSYRNPAHERQAEAFMQKPPSRSAGICILRRAAGDQGI